MKSSSLKSKIITNNEVNEKYSTYQSYLNNSNDSLSFNKANKNTSLIQYKSMTSQNSLICNKNYRHTSQYNSFILNNSHNKSLKIDSLSHKYITYSKETVKYNQRINIMKNRIDHLKRLDEEAKTRLRSLKERIIQQEEKKKIIKLNKKIVVEAKESNHHVYEKKKSKVKMIKEHFVKKKEELIVKKQVENRKNYSISIRNRRYISDLISQINDHEEKIKHYKCKNIKKELNKIKTETKLKTIVNTHNRRNEYFFKVEKKKNEIEEKKLIVSKLEKEESDHIEKLTKSLINEKNKINEIYSNKTVNITKTTLNKILNDKDKENTKKLKVNPNLIVKKLDFELENIKKLNKKNILLSNKLYENYNNDEKMKNMKKKELNEGLNQYDLDKISNRNQSSQSVISFANRTFQAK